MPGSFFLGLCTRLCALVRSTRVRMPHHNGRFRAGARDQRAYCVTLTLGLVPEGATPLFGTQFARVILFPTRLRAVRSSANRDPAITNPLALTTLSSPLAAQRRGETPFVSRSLALFFLSNVVSTRLAEDWAKGLPLSLDRSPARSQRDGFLPCYFISTTFRIACPEPATIRTK